MGREMKWRAWLRLSVFVAVVCTASGALLVRQVRARADDALRRVGSLLMAYADADHQQAPRTLVLNGAEMKLSVGTTARSVSDVLDYFQERCQQGSGNLGAQLATLTSVPADRLRGNEAALLDGIYRVDSDRRGVIACVDVGQARLAVDELAARAQAFADTGDLTRLGHLRFVTVERGAHRTVFVAMWTEGPLPLATMFPAHGDAPGHDVPGVPRPHASRRILSSWEAGQSKSTQLYVVRAGDVAAQQQRFATTLKGAGFDVLDRGEADAAGFVATRGEQAVLVTFGAAAAAETLVSISSLSLDGDATAAAVSR